MTENREYTIKDKHRIEDNPVRFSARISRNNDLFLEELAGKWNLKKSAVVRIIFYRVQDLYVNGFDIIDKTTLELLRDKVN